jgi:isopentenyl-diphosphate delta-isomerase
MDKVTPTSTRKLEHIQINLQKDVKSKLSTGLEKYHFKHRALPELDLDEVNLNLEVFGRKMKAPLLISSMTGGTTEAAKINRVLANAAQHTGVAFGVGSQRSAIETPELAKTFKVRDVAPDILLLANLGAVQLNYGYGIDECQRAVDMIEADALILHFNALQEALQPEGDTRFSGLLDKLDIICNALPIPVIAKEVGWGFSETDARQLANVGIAAIDVAGAGGTSWSQVEMYRAKNDTQARLAGAFTDWGIPTTDAIINVRRAAPGMEIFASGGLRSGIDIAKCIALGATIGGIAGPFLKTATESLEATTQKINEVCQEIKICMFAVGAANLNQLTSSRLEKLS